MQFDQATLEKSAAIGSQKVAMAFAKISGTKAEVVASKVEIVTVEEALAKIKPTGTFSIVVYAQLLSGVTGASFLILPRESALALVDLLNQQAVGTTGILKDIDRSALKEILNILSNSYMTSLAETSGLDLGLGVPTMVTADRLTENVAQALSNAQTAKEQAVVFETTVTIATHKITASIYLVFGQSALDLVK